MRISPPAARKAMLEFRRIPLNRISPESAEQELKEHYGVGSVLAVKLWKELCKIGRSDMKLTKEEKTMKGFFRFSMALHFMWTYPKNAKVFGRSFKGTGSMSHARGAKVKIWMLRIAHLRHKAIRWPVEEFNDPNGHIFIVSGDCTDFRQQEKKHDEYHRDEKECSEKLKQCACKFEIAIHLWKSQVVWINGPFRGGKHDKTIFVEDGLGDIIPKGKIIIVDRAYKIKDAQKEYKDKVSMQRPTDNKELNEFKSRARSRHEKFNGRMKRWSILSGDTFRHGGGGEEGRALFGKAVFAVAVICQFEMDLGSKLFDV